MRQDRLIFIILIMATAVILGTTFALVTTLTNEAVRKEITARSEAAQLSVAVESEEEEMTGDSAVTDSESSPEYSSIYLSPTEIREIKRMLGELGYNDPTLSASIKSFQSRHQIVGQSTLDGNTLDSIINQLSLSKSRSFW